MATHAEIDSRSLAMATAIAERIDNRPELLDQVRGWAGRHDHPAVLEWRTILSGSWEDIRAVLLDETEEGKRLRQSSPFVGILTPQERWSFYPRLNP